MLFSSLVFIYLFLPFVIFCYYILFRWSRFAQNLFLLFVSLIFYAWSEPKFVLILINSILLNWLFGLIVDAVRGRRRLCSLILTVDIVFNLSILFTFKYLSFTCSMLNRVLGLNIRIPVIVLPIGISFFTFQAMSYVIDVYRQKAPVQKNLFYVGLYISFFPQLIAGPIVRYVTIADQIKNRRETWDDFFDGFARFVVGLSKKVLLANSFAILADRVFNANKNGDFVSVAFCWLGALAYSLQILFDFSGYSDMAIGLGRMFGFHFLENFDYPYISTSITEFWRRWHISLGTWFRDYLYIPLGGNRCSRKRNVLNLFIVWLLTGLWHGANNTFIVWGILYFFLLLFERYSGWNRAKGRFIIAIKWVYTMFFVMMGWVLFRADTITDAFHYFRKMFGLDMNPLVDGLFSGWFSQTIILMCIGILICTPLPQKLLNKIQDNILFDLARVSVLICLFILSIASLTSNTYNPFIYFNF